MRRPFEKLMELVVEVELTDGDTPLGDLAARWDEPVERIMDAIIALRVMRGEKTYV